MANKAVVYLGNLTPTVSGFGGTLEVRYGPDVFPGSSTPRLLDVEVVAQSWSQAAFEVAKAVADDASQNGYILSAHNVLVPDLR